MTVGTVQIFDGALDYMLGNGNTQWDDATADSFAFILVKASHAPLDTDSTIADLGVADTDWIETGDGAPIEATSRAVNASGANTYLDSANADFGAAVTITAKYLVCVRGDKDAILSTDELMFWVDLDTTGGSVSSAAADFKVVAPTNGWLKLNQA